MRTGEHQTRVILRKGRLTPYCQRYPQGGVSGEVCQTRNIASNPAVAGLDLTVSNTQCKDQTEKVHPCRSPPAASGTSQGTHAEIHPTWLQNLVFHLTKDEMSNSKHKDEQTFQELWRAALSNQQQHSLSYSHLKWELSVSLATLQAKSVHWSVEAFGPLVSGAIWVGELVIWDYSVLNHSQLMCCGRSHVLGKISLSPSSSFPFILQTIKTV